MVNKLIHTKHPKALCCLISLISLILALLPTLAYSKLPIRQYHATYTIHAFGLPVGKSIQRLTITPQGHYELLSQSRSTFPFYKISIDIKSAGSLTPELAYPSQFSFHRRSGNNTRNWQLNFNRRTEKAVIREEGAKTRSYSIEAQTQDELSEQIQLQLDLIQFNPERLQYSIAKRKQLMKRTFEIEKAETVKTGIGNLVTTKVTTTGEDEKATFWLSEQHDYVIARAVYDNSDFKGTIVLDTLTLTPIAQDDDNNQEE